MENQTNSEVNGYVEPMDVKMKYGAPELKKLYLKFAKRGLILAVVIHIVLISAYIFSVYLEKLNAEKRDQFARNIELKDIQTNDANKEDDTPPPPEIEPQKVEALKDLAALTPEPVAKEKADIETIKKVEETEKIKAFVSSEGSENFDPTKETKKPVFEEKKVVENVKKEESKEKKEKIFQQFEVDKAPLAVNLSSVQSSMRYPEIARSNGIEGRVTVKVLVGPDGGVIQVGSCTGPEVFWDEVKSRVTNLQFNPAIQQGSPVKCWVTVPFSFTLSGKFKKDNNDADKKDVKDEKKKEDPPKQEEKK